MDPYSPLLFFFILSWLFSLGSNQLVWHIAQRNQIVDQPNARSSHSIPVPRIGGVVFFTVFLLTLLFLGLELELTVFSAIFLGALLLFSIGLYDDLFGVEPKLKLIAQMTALLLLFIPYFDALLLFRAATFFALIPVWLFVLLTYFFFLTLINAINLIDGINGLAALLSIEFFITMGLFFDAESSLFHALWSWILVGSLIAFLFFNLSKCRKIFMGDCGSLLLGFFMCAFALHLMKEIALDGEIPSLNHSQYIILFAALFFLPMFDLFRVFTVRLVQGKKIFHPDRSHIHHLLIDRFGRSHLQATLLLTAFQLALLFLASIYF